MNGNIICSCSADFCVVGCNRRQAMRFIGCDGVSESGELDRIYDECLEQVGRDTYFRAVWRKSSLSFVGDDTVEFDFGRIKSASLCKNLEGCRSAYVFAATAGFGIDRLMLRYKNLDPVRAMVISGIGSSCVECWCDLVNEKIADGRKTRPRFSPGYGGVELSHQKEIFDFLEVEKRVGITLTDSFFMTPVKSVTAFIGIVEE